MEPGLKDLAANLEYRRNLHRTLKHDRPAQKTFWRMCAEDPLFYFNSCLWIFAPNDDDELFDQPFITYDYQDDLILKLINCARLKRSVNVKKSRDMGGSWTTLGTGRWLCKFHRDYTLGLMSWKEDYVDQGGSKDALFQKLDYLREKEMPFMREKSERKQMTDKLENGSDVRGETANPNAFRAARRRLIFWDEAAATPNAFEIASGMALAAGCMCRVYTSKGTATEAYALEQSGSVDVVELNWKLNPSHTRGLYQIVNGQAKLLDHRLTHWKGKKFPEEYKFVTSGPTAHEGQIRSPWYDYNCGLLHNVPVRIAQELDINDKMAQSLFFDVPFIDRAINEYCTRPDKVCRLDFRHETCEPKELIDDPAGHFKFWNHFPSGKPLRDRTYSVACDVSYGGGASNSTMAIIDDKLREKIGSYANPMIQIHDFARLAVATCRMFIGSDENGAMLAWERLGPGDAFGRVVTEEIGYHHVYYEPGEKETPGWTPTKYSKIDLLGELKADTMEAKFIDREEDCWNEQKRYICLANGKVAYSDKSGIPDSAGGDDAHGDRTTAAAIGNRVSKSRQDAVKPEEAEYEEGSRGWRDQQRKAAQEGPSRRTGWKRQLTGT